MNSINHIYTIGHSSLTMEEFLRLLHFHGITAIADVRSQPYSRIYPHFSQSPLREALLCSGTHYVFLGRELGARRDEPECYVDGRARYSLVAETPAFKSGLRRLLAGAEEHTIALLCAEKDPLVCHRSILVCRALRNAGAVMRHILVDGSIETHAEAERRLMQEEGLNPDQLGLFEDHDTAARIELAYDLRGEKIAYRLKDEDDK